MIIRPIDASEYRCCSDKSVYCSGEGCMAWRKEVERKPVEIFKAGQFPRPPRYEVHETGRGFCGLAYRGES